MKSSVVGMGRQAWGPLAPSCPHNSGKVTPGCASHIQHQKASNPDTGTSVSISRLGSLHQSVSFLGLRGLSRGKEEPAKLRSRFGELVGDCCLASVGSASSSRNYDRGIVRAKASPGSKGSSDDSRNDGGEEQLSSSVWDLSARHKRIQEAAAKVGDPFRDMMTNASKKLQDYLDNIKLSRAKDVPAITKTESEWEGWQKLFAEVDERERLVSVLKFQMEEAVDSENFQEAAALKQTIASATANDTVSEVMNGLKAALEEERYSDAAKFCDKAGAGLVGWWVGLTEGGKDPYGRIIHIAASQGRFTAKSYSARQLVAAAVGVPLFEVFVKKDRDNNFVKQAVYLQRDGHVAADAVMSPTSKDVDMINPQNGAKGNSKTKDSSSSSDKNENTPKNAEDFIDEGINNIISFLKDRMPDVRLKVLQVIAPDGLETDIPKLVEQLMGAEEKDDDIKDTDDQASSSNETPAMEESDQDKVSADSSTSSSEEQETPIRLVIGGVLQNAVEDKVPRAPLRVAAKIEHKNKDEFVFHIEESGTPSSPSVSTSTKESLPSWKVATIATQASADLMPDDVAKVLWNVDKVPVKVSKEMGEIIRLAVSQAQRRGGLSKSTAFRRINVSDGGMDPLNALYIGTFGPYTSEVVQLRRKYGQWQEDDTILNADKLEFFEYVEAVKLTGDLNVPAGQVTFRAKIGRENRLSLRGAYPEELGVVGRYKGQGRLADPGFRNPQWIDGEMVLLDGKGGGHTNGAELGFVYSVPERHFLVLFNRLNLRG